MKKLLIQTSQTRIIAKTLGLTLIVFLFVMFPEKILHYLLILMHIVYESFAYVVEETLIAMFDLSRSNSQLIFFYLSCSVGIFTLYLFC